MDTHYADTTVIYYRLHSHSLLQAAVRDAVGKGTLAVSNFVRGEYIRGFVTGLATSGGVMSGCQIVSHPMLEK